MGFEFEINMTTTEHSPENLYNIKMGLCKNSQTLFVKFSTMTDDNKFIFHINKYDINRLIHSLTCVHNLLD